MSGHKFTSHVYFVLSLMVCWSLIATAAMPAVAAPVPNVPESIQADPGELFQAPNPLYRTRITLRRPRDLAQVDELNAAT